MNDWKPDVRHGKVIGRFAVTPERRGNETAYRVTTPGDVRALRVLPSDQVTAQMRSRIVTGALMALEDAGLVGGYCPHDTPHPRFDAYTYLIGVLHLEGVLWEWVREPEPASFVDWLTGHGVDERMALELVDQAGPAGWEIRKKGPQQ